MTDAQHAQIWNPNEYAKEAGFVSAYGNDVVDWLAPQSGERVLDVGCGDGTLALVMMAKGCRVVGVDASPDFVAAAKKKGVDARLMDGQALAFDSEFDAVFTNAALHWMKDAGAVVQGVRRALQSGGRFVGEFGGQGNVARIIEALGDVLITLGIDPVPLNPWYFPSVDEYARLLTDNGFKIERIVLFERPTLLPDDILGWLETFAFTYTAAVSEPERTTFLAEVKKRLERSPLRKDGRWVADYVRLRFHAARD